MKKYLLFYLISMIACAEGFCQGKIDPRTVLFSKMHAAKALSAGGSDSVCRRVMAPGMQGSLVDALITLSCEMTEEELEELGVADPCVVGLVAAGRIDVGNIDALQNHESIAAISLSGKAKLHCDMARADAGVDIVRDGGMDLPCGYDGEGVIVSLFDQGIEPGHINFLSADRTKSRVKGIWHYETTQNSSGGTSTTESYYSDDKEIAMFVTDDATLTHGTHTLGIMAGSFGVNKEDPEYDYSGMAPGADILIGCGSLYYSNVLRAIKRFREFAAQEEKPLVVNLSFGDNIGPHDGTDAFPRALNSLAEEIPIFMSSGNEGKKPIAIIHTFGEADSLKTVIVPNMAIRTFLGVTWEAATEVQIWSEDSTPFSVSTGLWDKSENCWVFSLPLAKDGEASYIANGDYVDVSNYQNDDFDYLYKNSAIGISTGTDPGNNRYTADIWFMLDKQINHIDRNIVPVVIVTGEPGKRIDVYCDGDYNEFSAGRMEGWTSGDTDGSISNIACGHNTFAVGSYCSRPFTESSVAGEVSAFSSWGVLPDGRVLPDILAPGDCIVSSMSTPFTASDYYSSDTYPAVYGMMYGENPYFWTLQQGTSQSAPAMAGIAALWLQANPNLSPSEIKEILKSTARPTQNMTPQCGAGKVDALAGLKEALRLSGIAPVSAGDASGHGFVFDMSDGACAVANVRGEEFTVSVCDMSGRLVARIASGAGCHVDLSSRAQFKSGVYVIEARSERGVAVKKVAF